MDRQEEDPPAPENQSFKEQIENIADQLCLAVKGDFDFTVKANTTNETVQKLTMLLNFVTDTARRALVNVQEQNTKLTELDKLKSDFLANISHELRTPLTLILGPLETILSDKSLSLPQTVLDNLRRIQRNAMRLYVLVNDILDFSKVEAGKFDVHEELLDINQLISEIIDDAQGLAVERKLKLSFIPQEGLEQVLFDRKMIEKIVLNLVSNALKFTPDEGEVKVQITQEDDIIRLTVSDTGIGIPPDQISKLFERFHQVDSSKTRAHAGTGIGLALVSQFTELMNGHIKVESEVGKGSKFIVAFPKRSAVNKEEALASSPSKSPSAKAFKVSLSDLALTEQKKTLPSLSTPVPDNDRPLILVADDNPDMRNYIISLLANSYKIIEAENGKVALEAALKYHPHVILSDVMMPEMDGYELTKAIKSNPATRNIPVILITAQAGKEAIVSGLEIGADDYLPKPFSPEELKARTQSALRLYTNIIKLQSLNEQLNGLLQEISDSKKELENSNINLRQEITHRKLLAEKNDILNRQLVVAAERAGRASLHNIGNVLNSVKTSVSMLGERIHKSKVSHLAELAALMQQHEGKMETFIANDPQGQRIPGYLQKLSQAWLTDKNFMLEELNTLSHSIQHIKEIVSANSSLKPEVIEEKVNAQELIEDALTMNRAFYEQEKIKVIRNFAPLKPTAIDRVKLLQIMVNLIKNGAESIIESRRQEKVLTVHLQEKGDTQFTIQVSDNGMGIAPENLSKICSHGFTTKEHGHGFGLHASSLAVQEMGGEFHISSPGIGEGATFTVVLPYQTKERK